MSIEVPFSIGSSKWNGLSKVVEETSELNTVLGKLLGSNGDPNHWSGDLNEMIIEETADTLAALNFFVNNNFNSDDTQRILDRCKEKESIFEKWNKEQSNKED